MACNVKDNGLGFVFHTPGLGPEGSDMSLREGTSLKAVNDKYPELWEGNLVKIVCLGCGGLKWMRRPGGPFWEDPAELLKGHQWVKDPTPPPSTSNKKTVH